MNAITLGNVQALSGKKHLVVGLIGGHWSDADGFAGRTSTVTDPKTKQAVVRPTQAKDALREALAAAQETPEWVAKLGGYVVSDTEFVRKVITALDARMPARTAKAKDATSDVTAKDAIAQARAAEAAAMREFLGLDA